jgi:hypothetical protein
MIPFFSASASLLELATGDFRRGDLPLTGDLDVVLVLEVDLDLRVLVFSFSESDILRKVKNLGVVKEVYG